MLVNDTIRKFQSIDLGIKFLLYPDKYVDKSQALSLLRKFYGITYRAPCDTRKTGLESESIDCITSTSTLEHITLTDIKGLLQECHRLLNKDGLISFRINYKDHYSDFDKNISIYNFLKYSDKAWAFFSPSIHFQNRLRHKDYLEIFHRMGFDVVEEQIVEVTAEDIKVLKQLDLNSHFKHYSLHELAIKGALIVLRKKVVNN